jgi:hypothetical protein
VLGVQNSFAKKIFHVYHTICSLLQEVEKDVKVRTKGDLGAAKTLCTPFDQPDLPSGMLYADN